MAAKFAPQALEILEDRHESSLVRVRNADGDEFYESRSHLHQVGNRWFALTERAAKIARTALARQQKLQTLQKLTLEPTEAR